MKPINSINNKIKVLLVEDVQADRIMIAKAIINAGYNSDLKFAENIDDALTLAFAHNFDCILLDYFYSTSGNGLDFIKTYQARGGQAPIVIITSHNDLNLAVETMKSGASDYISKQDLTGDSIVKSFNYLLRLKAAEESRLAAERALMESEMRMKSIIDRSPVIVFTIDSGGYFRLFKGRGVASINIKQQQIIGRNIQDIGHLIPVRYSDYREALLGKELMHRVEVNNHFFDVNYIPVCDHLGKITSMMGVAIDITDFKRNEVELKNTIEVTETESKIKQQFLANMRHEKRTPIHGILCQSDFILKTTLNTDQRKYLNLIKQSADNLLVIVNDVLDLSKIQADKMSFEEIPFNLLESLQSTIATLLPKAQEKGIDLKLEIGKNVFTELTGDPVRLSQIINNLVGNAIKFTEKGKVLVNVNNKEENENYSLLEFKVIDTGIGIPSQFLPEIFESFTQAGNDVSRKYGGTGLGLAIAKQLVEQQNGTITVQSKINEGTVFTFNIPYKVNRATKKINEIRIPRMMNETTTKKLNILVAEDNDINRFIIKKMIDDWGYNHEFATTGVEVIEKLSKSHFDLILMDVEMPEMNGYQATELIRKEMPATKNLIPIIAMTGHAMNGEKEKCLKAGMNDYISKPFQGDELRKKIIDCAELNSKKEMPKLNPSFQNEKRYTNLNFLLEISDGNDTFFKEFITLFLNSAPVAINDLETSLMKKDWEMMRQVAHKIKPSFNYVGLTELNKIAARIEDLAKKQSNLDELPSLINTIKNTCEIAYQELKQEIKIAA